MKLLLLLVSCLFVHANPFSIDFPAKQELSHEDYLELQRQIRQIDIHPLLQTMYPENGSLTTFDDLAGRCTRGTRQTLIDPEKGFYPIRELVKIGRGGDRCIVCCGSFNGKYPSYIQSLIQGLREQDFNGYFFYMLGGWPNPTGKEIKYVAVPYSFKIFTMLEAYKLGFNNVLWIDAACYPLRNIDYLFTTIAKKGALLNWYPTPSDGWRYILPQTRDLLQQLTGTNVLNASYINTIVFGLKMNRPDVQELIKIYYECAELGTPFLSCFPEEWVLTAIISKKRFAHFREELPHALVHGSRTNADNSPEEFEKVRKRGAFFYHRKGR